MKEICVFEKKEITEIDNKLRNINHSVSVIKQNLNNTACIEENLSSISKKLEEVFAIIRVSN